LKIKSNEQLGKQIKQAIEDEIKIKPVQHGLWCGVGAET